MDGKEIENNGCSSTTQESLVFAINGERFELTHVDPSTTLIEFLRTQTRFKGPKLGCGEGGCGACVVLLSKYDEMLDQVENFTISSCLTLLCSLHHCAITTTEGLGSSKHGFHTIHKRFSGFHASQCGFCTPGMCMSLYGALISSEKCERPAPPRGFSKLTVVEAEKAILGNLCRCTGYRPIADACKSFAADVDIEDLGFNSFWKKGDNEEVLKRRLPIYSPTEGASIFPRFLKEEIKSARSLNMKKLNWYYPLSLEDVKVLLESNKGSLAKLVVGNTGAGYYKDLAHADLYIDLRHITVLSAINIDDTGVEIGAAVTISKAIGALRETNKAASLLTSETVYKKIADHMEKVASGFIRNTASVGGNLVMAQRHHFPSDIATILLAAGSVVTVLSRSGYERLALEEFLERPPMDPESILLSVKISSWKSSRGSDSHVNCKQLFETYRAAPRPLGNALPYLNAAFLAEVTISKAHDGVLINSCQLAFGAYGTQHAIRAKQVEDILAGKILTLSRLNEAIKVIRATVTPECGTARPAYRSSLAVGFVFKFFVPFIESIDQIAKQPFDGYTHEFLAKESHIIQDHKQSKGQISPLLVSANQVVELDKEYHPVGEPIPKPEAVIQASGEAVYVDDIPSPKDCLYGAFIYSNQPLAQVKNIQLSSELPTKSIISIVSFRDIPDGGENVGSKTIFGTEPLFANEITECAGQAVAFVVANSQKHADMAAASAVVEYNINNLETPILTVEEAVKRGSFFDVPPFLYPKPVGDFSRGMEEADHKILSAKITVGSQYYFYVENQTALAVPDEDNCMTVYSSSQCPEYAHSTIARCLGVPEHNVRVITRRVGGGFGGKAVKAMPVATACALAAQKLQRPVRSYLNRKTDMIMAGGRHPMKITYSVGFKSNGKITALQLEILINAGISPDISPVMPHNMIGPLKKYNWGALSFDMKVCKTNHSSKSAMRAPGEVQASFIAEAVIEHVASALSMDVDSVRNINLHTESSLKLYYGVSAGEPQEYTLPSMWTKLGSSSNLQQRLAMVNEFNRCSKWKKRGISRVPICYEVAVRPTPGRVSILSDGSVVVEVGGIEIGQGLWTKVKQAVAYALGSCKCNGTPDLLEKIRVIQADTLSVIQGGFTAGSTTSEASCQAARLCCDILVERLMPLRQRLEEQIGHIKWETLIQQAYVEAVNLSASSFYVPEMDAMQYLNYGAAVSEVEVDILTGENRILRSDIMYDCGKSINPAVDLGQIEGAFVQGIGFFLLEEYLTNSDGLVVSDSTWTYKIPTLDTIPREFNVEIMNSGHHRKRILSSKASGEPPLLLAVSVHCATRAAIREARKQVLSWSAPGAADSHFQLDVPATMPVVKELCGLNSVESYLQWSMSKK